MNAALRSAALAVRMASSQRHALALFSDGGGLLLDTHTGSLFELNRSGCAIWESLVSHGSREKAERVLVEAFGLSPEGAAGDVGLAIEAAADITRTEDVSALWIHRSGDRHYQVLAGRRAVLAVDLEAGEIVAEDPGALPDSEILAQAFRVVAAKVLAREGLVLHASAVRGPGGIVAVAGPSGAGKTTTARAFATAGAALLSEDLLLVEATRDRALVRVGGEDVVRRWAMEAALDLARRPAGRLSWTGLSGALPPAVDPLSRLVFLSASRRGGRVIEERALDGAAATALAMRHAFVARLDPAGWRRHLQTAAQLACHLPVGLLSVPEGLDRLAAAAPDYISNSTS